MAGQTAAEFDADFSKFIGELNKVELKLREFGEGSKTATSDAKKLADSLNGNKIAEQAQVAVRAIQSIDGGVQALTRGELKRMGAVIDEATEKFAKMGRQVPSDMAAVKASLDAARASTEQAAAPAGGLMQMFSQGLGLGAGMSVFGLAEKALSAIAGQMKAMWEDGQKLSALGTAFTNLSGGAGLAEGKLDNAREATRGLVTDLELMQAANKASLLGLDAMGIKFDDMAGIAARLGKAMGQDAAKSVDDLTTALSRQSPMILDNLGISVKLSDAYDDYAEKLGKTAAALTEEEKKQAFASAAMDAAQQKVATLGEQTLTLGEQFTRLGNVLTNTRAELGQSANDTSLAADALGAYTDTLADTIDNLGDTWESFKNVNGLMLEQAGLSEDAADKLSNQLAPALAMLASPGSGLLNLAAKGFKALVEQMEATALAQRGLLDVANMPAPAPPTVRFSGRYAGEDTNLSPDADRAAHARSKAELDRYIKDRQTAYERDNEQRLAALENGGEKANKLIDKQHKDREKKEKEHQDRLAKLSGGDGVAAAIQASLDIKELKGKLGDDAAAKIFGELLSAKEVAKAIKPEAVAGIQAALDTLATNPGVVRQAREAGAALLKQVTIGLGGARASDMAGAMAITPSDIAGVAGVIGQTVAGVEQLSSKFNDLGVPMSVIDDQFNRFIADTSTWTGQVQSATEAFAQLAQVTQGIGGGLDAITGGIAGVMASANAGQQFASSISGMLGATSMTGTKGKVAGAAGVGLAGLSAGSSLAAMTGTTSKWKGAAAGALGGAAAGAMAGSAVPVIGTAVGAGIGAVAGAIGGMFTANKKAKEARALMQENRKELLAFYGSREELIQQASRFGISESEVSKNILNNEKNVEAYQKTLTKLTEATEKEKKQAEALAKNLNKVAAARGVLDQKGMKDLRDSLAVGEGPRTEVAQQFMAGQTDSLLQGLQGALESGPVSPKLVAAIGESLPAAFAQLKAAGVSSIDALRQMAPVLESFQKNAVLAGAGSTPGFDALNASLSVLKDEKLGPLVQQAEFAAQSMAALQNLGYGNQAAFSGFAGSITDTFNALSAGAGAEQALALMQAPLQNVWQLAKDFGYETDEATKALLEQAQAAGTVGDKFRPAADRMATALDTVVTRLDELIAVFTGELVTDSQAGANQAGQAIIDEFAKVQPVVRVKYEYDMPDAPPVTPRGGGVGSQAARVATEGGGDIYMDGERVGMVVGRHLGKVSDYAGA